MKRRKTGMDNNEKRHWQFFFEITFTVDEYMHVCLIMDFCSSHYVYVCCKKHPGIPPLCVSELEPVHQSL